MLSGVQLIDFREISQHLVGVRFGTVAKIGRQTGGRDRIGFLDMVSGANYRYEMKSESITKVNWDLIDVVSDSVEFPIGSQVYAVWPSPANHDACFESAGFTDFADVDDSWDREFEEMLRVCISALQTFGEIEILKGVDAAWNYSAWERVKLFFGVRQPVKDLDLWGQLALAAEDDQCGDCIVGFGSSGTTILKTGSGHSIIWIRAVNGGKFEFSSLIEKIANGRPVEQMKLDWKYLAY